MLILQHRNPSLSLFIGEGGVVTEQSQAKTFDTEADATAFRDVFLDAGFSALYALYTPTERPSMPPKRKRNSVSYKTLSVEQLRVIDMIKAELNYERRSVEIAMERTANSDRYATELRAEIATLRRHRAWIGPIALVIGLLWGLFA